MAPDVDPLQKYVGSVLRRVPGFELVDRIDAGSSATVYLIRKREEKLALKIYDPKFLAGSNRAIELRRIAAQQALSGHSCPSLIGIHSSDEIGDTAFLLMEYVPWAPLAKQIANISPAAIRSLISQVAEAAEFLDTKELVHRDIKPANILISDDFQLVKLVDLGVVRPTSGVEVDATDHGLQRPFVATAQYSSPEYLFRLVQPSPAIWRALTFYQLGAVLHDLIMRTPLFKAAVETGNRYAVAMAVYREVPVIRADDVDADLVVLARQCLLKNHEARLAHVSWARFSRAPIFDAGAARIRLGLKSAHATEPVSLPGADHRHHELALKNALSLIRDAISGVIEDEGYPRPKYSPRHMPETCTLEMDFELSTPTGDHGSLCISLGLCWVEEYQAIQVSLGGAIGDGRVESASSAQRPTAITYEDRLVDDLSGPLKTALSEHLLRYFDAASIILASGRLVGLIEPQ